MLLPDVEPVDVAVDDWTEEEVDVAELLADEPAPVELEVWEIEDCEKEVEEIDDEEEALDVDKLEVVLVLVVEEL